ncbi:MAG: MFS transporter [Burkholderiaceae bacterium]
MSAERTPAGAERARAGAGRDADPAAARALRRLAVLVIAIGFVFNLLGRGMSETWAVFLLPIENEFGWRRQDVTSVYSVYLMVNGLMAPFAGMLFDRFGPRASYGLGTALFGLAALGAAHAQAQWHFFVLSGLAFGISSAVIGMVPASVLIARWFAAGLGRDLVRVRGLRDRHPGAGADRAVVDRALRLALDLPGLWQRDAAVVRGRDAAAVAATRGRRARGHGGTRRCAPGQPIRRRARGPAHARVLMLAQAFHFTALGMYLVIPRPSPT